MSEPGDTRKEPFAVEVKAGRKYFWCKCRHSATPPFCDGSHKGLGIAPLMFVASADETVYVCGCGATATAPFCDGSHERV